MKKLIFSLAMFAFMMPMALMANKTSVKISAPEKSAKGSPVTIKIEVMHKGNSGGHHTDWVYVMVNGKEIKRWAYDKKNLPPAGDFTLEIPVDVDGDLTIEVKGDCNIHGSAGAQTVTIKAME